MATLIVVTHRNGILKREIIILLFLSFLTMSQRQVKVIFIGNGLSLFMYMDG